MYKERDKKLISLFRENSRLNLTTMSRRTKIPISTIYDKLKEYHQKNLIFRHTCLLNFKELGFNIRVNILIKSKKETKEKLFKYLKMSPSINTLSIVNSGFDYYIEGIFQDFSSYNDFSKKLEDFEVQKTQEFFIMEDIKREDFLAKSL